LGNKYYDIDKTVKIQYPGICCYLKHPENWYILSKP